MKKNGNNMKSMILSMVLALAICGCGSTGSTEYVEPSTVTETATVVSEIVSTDEEGNLVDGLTGEVLDKEKIKELEKQGVIKTDESGKSVINEEKNTQTVNIVVNGDGDVLEAKTSDGKDVTKSAKNNEKVKEVANTEAERIRETIATNAATEVATKKATEIVTSAATERTTEMTTPPTEKNTTKETERQTEKQTEKVTEKATEKATEKQTERQTEQATERQTELQTEKATEAATERQTEKQTEAATECPHNWVWKTHVETIHHDAVYKEVPVYTPEYDEPVKVKKILCKTCWQFFDDNDAYYALGHECAGNARSTVSVIDHYIHHDAEFSHYTHELVEEAYDEKVTVNDYEYCSICGVKK